MATKSGADNLLRCSFCGKSSSQVKKMVAGPGVYICDECIELCVEIIEEDLSEDTPATLAQPERSVEEDLERMVAMHASREQVDAVVAEAVRGLRTRGVTWTRIGTALGISRQSAWERYSGEE